MDKINYTDLKHRGDVGRDIPNIYFCAHHDDRELLFDKIYDVLSKEIECALWYDESPSPDADIKKRTLELEQMCLIVVPVTRRLLTSESRALKVEIPLAREKGIPVLPLVIEKIADERFNELFALVFGNMQYLVFDRDDPSAISFNDKLRNYLSSVIVSPELNERITNSFDGYIFLSYRKKDREHILPLMKTIHQSPELRDVAVWYDEFLTPGEDFTNNIEKNLKKSNIFLLAVTPNILEKGNYVMTTEYPSAIQNEKPVVAAEIVKTSRESLERYYAEIPPCIPSGGSEVLCAQLKSKLANENVERDKKSELEHKFLMGMAYFSGIDLETDKDRALDLLEEAADEEYLEAMEQLSSFYRNGIGIRNTDSRERQMRYVLLCKERYEREGTEKSAIRFADALEAMGNLEDSLIRFGEFDMTKLGHHPIPDACLLAIALLERTNEKYKTLAIKRKLIATYDSICDRYTITRRNGMIIDYGLKSIALLEEMAKLNYNTDLYENIAKRYRALERGAEAETALEYLQNAVMFYNKAKGKDRSPETLKGYIYIFESLSFCLLHRVKDRYDESRLVSEKLLALREELFEKEPYPENGIELCKKYLYFADLVSNARVVFQIFTPEDRLGFCSRVDELMDSLFADAEAVGHIQYSLTLKRLLCTAKAYDELEDNERAAEYYLKYILQLENAPANEISENHTRNKAEAYLALSKIFERMGFGGRATKCVLKAISFGTLEVYDYSDFMSEYVKKADSDTLAAFAADGFDHYSDLVDENTRGRFADLCISAYEICLKSGSSDAALKYLRSGIDAQRTVAETTGSRKDKIFLFRILAMLGDLYLRSESKTEAVTAYLECVIVGNSIGDRELLAEDHRILASVCHTVASFAEEEEDLERAEKYYILALKSRYRLYLMSNQREELSEGKAPLIAIYKKQGNGLFVIKKTFALSKQVKQWATE